MTEDDLLSFRAAPLTATGVFGKLAQPVSLFTERGVYEYVNAAGLELLKMTASDLVGHSDLDVFPDLATHPFHEAFQRVASGVSDSERLQFHYEPAELWSSQQIVHVEGHVVGGHQYGHPRTTDDATAARRHARIDGRCLFRASARKAPSSKSVRR